MKGDFAWTATEEIRVPDNRIEKGDPSYTLVPCRGYGGSLAVLDTDKICIGWMPVEVLGCSSVKEWVEKTNYIASKD